MISDEDTKKIVKIFNRKFPILKLSLKKIGTYYYLYLVKGNKEELLGVGTETEIFFFVYGTLKMSELKKVVKNE